jgi:glycosyltransferase involved in cell wall biosynthesis
MKMDYFVLRHYFTRAVAVSQEMKKVLVQKYRFSEEKVEIIYNGITLPSVKAPPDSSPHDYFHIGTVGRLVPVKDFHLFLDVAAEIRRQTKKVRFSILGDGPLKEQLIQKAEDLKMQDCVEFLSPLPDPLPYYQSLDLYLNTSLHEGIPLSILEAMACAKPVIAPRVGGIPEIISHGEHGWMVEEHNPEKIALAILNLLNDPDLRLGLGENAFKRVVSCFSSYRMAEAYTQFYQQQ